MAIEWTHPPGEYENWTKSDKTYPQAVVTPQDPADLVAIVPDPVRCPSPVRAAGHLHSTNPCFATNAIGTETPTPKGTLVLMRPNFSRVEVFTEPAAGGGAPDVYVRAGAGARMIDIRNALAPWNRELAVSPEIGSATAGSVACGGTKDSTLSPRQARDQSQISSLLVEAKLVDANGNRV
jgi:FAD/FMN-containing dehydrogenase